MRILAFGDSLTAGYHSMGAAYAPWACTLCQLLGAEVVDHIGLSGFTTAELVRSMDECSVTDVASRTWSGLRHKLRSAAVPYDIVLIMAGTNDLAGQVSTAELVDNLLVLHAAAHAAGARSVVMTIPQSKAALEVGWLGTAQDDANAAIRALASSSSAKAAYGFGFVDAAALVPFSEAGPPFLWEQDGLHMSPAGYEAFGQGLAPRIRDFVWVGTATPAPALASGASDE